MLCGKWLNNRTKIPTTYSTTSCKTMCKKIYTLRCANFQHALLKLRQIGMKIILVSACM